MDQRYDSDNELTLVVGEFRKDRDSMKPSTSMVSCTADAVDHVYE